MSSKMVENVFNKRMAYCRTLSDSPYRVACIGMDRHGVYFEILTQADTTEVKEYYTNPEALEKRMREVSPDGKLKGWGRVNYYFVKAEDR